MKAVPAALAALTLLALAGCSGSGAGDEDAAAAASAQPASTAEATETEETGDGAPAAINRDSNVNIGAGSFERFPVCMHDGPVAFSGGEAEVDPTSPTDDLAEWEARLRIRVTESPDYLELGPDGRAYASVPFDCTAVGGDAPEGAAARVDSGHLIVGGTEDDLIAVGLVTAGGLASDASSADDSQSAEEAAQGGLPEIEPREPAGQGRAYVHSSLRNGDGYRYFLRTEAGGDEPGTPSGREWATFGWDDATGSVRQLERSASILDTVPRPEETVVVGAAGDRGVLAGDEDLSGPDTLDELAERLGEPDADETETVTDTAYAGYERRRLTWGSFTAELLSPPADTEWATCLTWTAELGDLPPEITLDTPLRWGPSLQDLDMDEVEDRPDISDTAALVVDDDDRFVTETLDGSPRDGMINSITSGTGCRDTPA